MTGGVSELMQDGALWAVGFVLLILVLLLFHRPLHLLLRLLLRTVVGLTALTLFAPLGHLLGISLGVNLWNGLILGALGVPGFGLLLLLHWVAL